MNAAQFPRPDIVRMLIASGAEVNAVANDGRTALLSAIWSDDSTAAVVKALIEGGADVNIRDARYGLTPREWAVNTGNLAVVELIDSAN